MVDRSSWALVKKPLGVKHHMGAAGLLRVVVDDSENIQVVDGGGPLEGVDIEDGVVAEELGEVGADRFVSTEGRVQHGAVVSC